MLEFSCPNCDAVVKAPENAGGRKGTCRTCGAKVFVPNGSVDANYRVVAALPTAVEIPAGPASQLGSPNVSSPALLGDSKSVGTELTEGGCDPSMPTVEDFEVLKCATADCPHCGALLTLNLKDLGESHACPECHGQFGFGKAATEQLSGTSDSASLLARRVSAPVWAIGCAILLLMIVTVSLFQRSASDENEYSRSTETVAADSDQSMSESDRADDIHAVETMQSALVAELDRMEKVRAVETKRLNWNTIPESEKSARSTTGKVVFKGVDSRLIISHYEDGRPRFSIQQSTPTSIGQFSTKAWISYGEQEAWTVGGSHIRFFVEDTTPYGTWVVTNSDGHTRARIRFEDSEPIDATLRDPEGNNAGLLMYSTRGGWWTSGSQELVREIEGVINFVRECARSAAQL